MTDSNTRDVRAVAGAWGDTPGVEHDATLADSETLNTRIRRSVPPPAARHGRYRHRGVSGPIVSASRGKPTKGEGGGGDERLVVGPHAAAPRADHKFAVSLGPARRHVVRHALGGVRRKATGAPVAFPSGSGARQGGRGRNSPPWSIASQRRGRRGLGMDVSTPLPESAKVGAFAWAVTEEIRAIAARPPREASSGALVGQRAVGAVPRRW